MKARSEVLAEAILTRIGQLKKKMAVNGKWPKGAREVVLEAIKDEIEQANKTSKGFGDDIELIYAAYPRKVAPALAKQAIEKALLTHDAAYLLERTQAYAKAVSRWDRAFRYRGTQQSDIVPHPASWFNRASFEDDPKEWNGPGGHKAPEPAQKAAAIPKPQNWVVKAMDKFGRENGWTAQQDCLKKGDGTIVFWRDLERYEGLQQEIAQ